MAYTRKGENGVVGDINQATDVNGGDSSHVLSYLQKMQRMDFDVLLLNCGLHDIKVVEGRQVEPEEYRENLKQVLELMRERGDKINLARYAYLLARMEPKENADETHKELYREFSKKMYQWMKDDAQCRQAIEAIMIYIYTIRE